MDSPFFKTEEYLGISGEKIHSTLYLALGLSGAYQHLSGVRNAKNIVCVNADAKASIFNNADYGIVGKVEDVVPELIAALSS